MGCCKDLISTIECCKPVDNSEFIAKLIKVTNDKFIKFLLKNNIDIVEISHIWQQSKGKRSFNYTWRDECELLIKYNAFNMEGSYWMRLSEKQSAKLFKK